VAAKNRHTKFGLEQLSLMMVELKRNLQVNDADRRINISRSSLLGVFACCTEETVLVPHLTRPRTINLLERCLGRPPIPFQVAGSSLLGSLICGNSKGFILTSYATNEEINRLSDYGDVARLPGKISAVGNVILSNDNAALVHPALSERACERISKTLGVQVEYGTIGGLKTVGMAAVVTNKGLLAHPRLTDAELAILEDLFQLPVDVGTVNFGSPLVGSGILASSRGYVAGKETTGPELGRIEDALGFME